MIITRQYALRLIKQGKAVRAGNTRRDDQGNIWIILNRLDLQRTDHYKALRCDQYDYD